jgi:CheY-like chemotaxis protein
MRFDDFEHRRCMSVFRGFCGKRSFPNLVPFSIERCVKESLEINPVGNLIDVTMDFPPTLPNALGDHDQLRIVFANLIHNARDAMSQGGRLFIRGSAIEAEVEVDTCLTLPDIFTDLGYRVCLAHDEDAAAERLNGRDYNVVLIDMKLPRSDGQRVFTLVRELNSQARTIAIAGSRLETEPLLQRLVTEGIDAVCYKPFDTAALLSTIERLAGLGSEREGTAG